MKKLTFILLLLLSFSVFSQTDSGDLEVYLSTILDNNPGDSGDNYKIPTASDMTNWENCINAILADDIATARAAADLVNYRIVEYTLTVTSVNRVVYILEEKATRTNHWGTYVFDATPVSVNMVLQAPHSHFDFNTGKQAIYCFTRLQTRFLFLNGAHRCNHNQASTCSGTTSVCSGSSEAFKISDLAHNVNSVFQKTTEIIHDSISDSVFIQLHGFSKQASDPYVILSNGSDQNPSGMDYASLLKDELFKVDNSLTFKVAHTDNWTRLVGFTNTQGRYINSSANVCNLSATSSSGRFVHLEQEKSKLRQDATGWDKLFVALNEIFNHTVSVKDYNINIQFKSKNPFQNTLEFHVKDAISIEIYSLLGNKVYSKKNTSNNVDFSIDTSNFSSGIYLLKVNTNRGFASKKLIRE